MEYTIVIVNNSHLVQWAPRYYFRTQIEAERYAEGITFGLWQMGKKWAVVMLLDGKYDPVTTITKNLTQKQSEVLFREAQICVSK